MTQCSDPLPQERNAELVCRTQTQFLTGIRGYAALAVVAVHCTGVFKGYSSYTDDLLNFGRFGVLVFFVLSAFSLSISMSHNPLKNTQNIVHYFSRRFWRIMPLYVLMCFVCAFFMNSSSTFDLLDLFMHVTLLNTFNHQYANSLIHVEWTIQLEMLAYLFLPVMFMATKNLKWRWGILLTLVFYIIGKQSGSIERLLPEGQTFYEHKWSLLKHFFAFFLGVLAFNRIKSTHFRWSSRTHDMLVYGLIVFLFAFVLFFQTSARLVVALWVVALIFALLKSTAKSRILFENRFILLVGKVSFSVYLVHIPLKRTVLSPLVESLGAGSGFFVFISIVLGLSVLSYHWVEAPCIRWGKLVYRRWLFRTREAEELS